MIKRIFRNLAVMTLILVALGIVIKLQLIFPGTILWVLAGMTLFILYMIIDSLMN